MESSLKCKSVVVLVCVLSLLVVGAAEGATITVKADGTGDYPTIQAAIDAAVGGDEVVLEQGTYTGIGNRNIDYNGKSITVRSTNPEDPGIVAGTIIDCYYTSEYTWPPFQRWPGRGFHFHSGEDANSILAGVTITNGLAPVVEAEWPFLWRYSYGGGILCDGSSPTITHCRIVGNEAVCTVPVYYSLSGGGGICGLNDSAPIISYCTIADNSTYGAWSGSGGGIRSCHGPIINCIITGNSATATNGGSGGGLSGYYGSITNCTISNNYADGLGGGIYLGYSFNSTISNCILVGNEAENGPQVALIGSPEWPVVTFSYSNIEGGEGAIYIENDCTLNWGEGNIDLDALLTNEGHLRAGSFCINAGDPNYVAGPGETDIDGEVRVHDGRIDIGADEFIDSDGDGLPDWWEKEYFGDPTAANPEDDPDGDGTDNLTEYNQGRNPTRSPFYYVNPVDGNDMWDGRSAVWDGVHGPKATIQAAIDATISIENDVVILAEGSYRGDGNRDLDFKGKAITVRSTNPDDASVVSGTVIDCEWAGHRGFKFVSGEGPGSVLSGVTIMNGYAAKEEFTCGDDEWNLRVGGGIFCVGSSPTITKCVIKENIADYGGGGIFAACGSPTITKCVIKENTAVEGSGIFAVNGSPTISGCTIADNSGWISGGIKGVNCNFNITGCRISGNEGGGIFCYGSDWSVTGCTITGNSRYGILCGDFHPDGSKVLISDCVVSDNLGTGIECYDWQGQATITDCVISGNGNPAERDGGGGVVGSGSEDDLISNCIITGNYSAWDGGGIAYWLGTISNCTISDNVADGHGGGLWYCEGTIENCIIRGNRAIYGGGISHFQGEIRNCVIAENIAEDNSGYGNGYGGAAAYCNGLISNCTIVDNYAKNGIGIYSSSAVTIANSILRGNGMRQVSGDDISVSFTNIEGGEDGVSVSNSLDWGEGNIDAEPWFALDGDYHLMPGSAGIDEGDPNYVPGPNDADIEGKVRVMGEAVDMGAYEFCPNSPAIAVSGRSFSFYPEWPEREPQELEIRNCGDEPLYWEIVEDCEWLEVVPANGVSEGEIDKVEIRVDANGLLPGVYKYTFEISDANASNSPVGIKVTMPVGSIIAVPSQDCPTIQCAIDAAEEYDIVVVADGVYSGEGNEDLDFGGKAIAVCSENGPENCVIEHEVGQWGFYFQNFEGADSMVKGFTMRNAAINCRKGSPTIKGCVVKETTGHNSGGIICGSFPSDEESHPTIVNCIVKNNSGCGISGGYGTKIINCIVSGNQEGGIAGLGLRVEGCEITDNTGFSMDRGGGIYCIGGSKISNCEITGNSSYLSGGIHCDGDTEITNCIISDNSAEFCGGVSCSGTVTITNSIISGNRAEYSIGGIYAFDGNLTITGCKIMGNQAKETGGLSCSGCENVEISNCVFTGNSAEDGGGAMVFGGNSNVSIRNCTVSGNKVSSIDRFGAGGGISCYSENVSIDNSILWGNEGPEGPQIYVGGDSNTSVSYTDVQGGQDDVYVGGDGTLNWGEGNMETNPGFALAGDWHLAEGSVCIDRGDPNYMAGVDESDADGSPRVLDGDGDGNSVLDMGAHEFNSWAATIAVSPKEFSFYYAQDWVKPEPQVMQIRNCGGKTLNWEIVEDCNWLEVAPANGVSEGEIDEVEIRVEPNLLELGAYQCRIEVRDANAANSPVEVDVSLRIGALLRVPGQYETIQSAIDAAEDYDMVLVSDGVYTGYGNRDLDYKGKAIIVSSENGAENCIIDCNGTEEEPNRGFYFHNQENEDSILDGFTITNGWAMPGGGIFCDGSSPTIRNCVIKNGWSHSGGGVYCYGGSPIISNCIISGNRAGEDGRGRGGGIGCDYRSSARIVNCVVTGNVAGDTGGGIYCEGVAMISGCSITANTAGWACGGLWVSGMATVVNCEITDNSAYSVGGIYSGGMKSRIENCIISGNTASDAVGGVCFGRSDNKGSVMANCLIAGNKSLGYGTGGVACMGGTISNCTIVGNFALNLGGGATCEQGDVDILNCIMRSNKSPAGSEIYLRNEGVVFVSYSDVEGGAGSVYVEPNSVLEWGLGNIDMEPGFVEAGYWGDVNDVNIVVEPNDANAVWVDGDYHLLEGSACINAGDPNYAAGPGETDLDGMLRVLLGRVDMGAYEFDWPPLEVEVRLTPRMLNCESKGKWVKTHIVLPEGYWPEDIDVNTPAVAEPMGVESEYIKVFDNGKGKFGVEIGFDREAFCAVEPESEDGYLEVKVTGWLLTGQRFEGTDMIKVISRRWRYRERITTIRRGIREIR